MFKYLIQLLINVIRLNLSYCKLSKIIRMEIIVEKLVPLSQGLNGSIKVKIYLHLTPNVLNLLQDAHMVSCTGYVPTKV